MAGRRRTRGRRVRTAAQRASIKKAQAASARKRRKRQAKAYAGTGLRIAGSVAGTFLSYHAQDIIRHPNKGKRYAKTASAHLRKYKHRNHGAASRHASLGIPKVPPRTGYNPRYM